MYHRAINFILLLLGDTSKWYMAPHLRCLLLAFLQGYLLELSTLLFICLLDFRVTLYMVSLNQRFPLPHMTNLSCPMFAFTSLSLSKFLCLCVSLIFHMTCSPPQTLPASQGRCLHTRFCFLFLPLPSSASTPSLTHPTSSSPALLLFSPLSSGVDLRLASFAFRLEVLGVSLPGLSSRMLLLQIQT